MSFYYNPNSLYHQWKGLSKKRRDRIDALEREVSSRESEMSKEEAKMYLDHSTTLYEQLVALEPLLLQTDDGRSVHTEDANSNYMSCYKLLELRKKLARISSQTQSTVTTPESPSQSELQSRIKKQKFHIERIESFEINDDICPVKAQVLYEQVAKHYEWFTLNQAEINAQVDNVALADQKTITEQIQDEVTDIQVKLKKIMTPEISELDSLVKKSDFLIHQIESLQSKNLVCADKAKISYNQLSSLYDSFLSNQMKIETHLTGDTLVAQRKISARVQQNVIESLTNLKKIFEPASVAVPFPLDLFQSRSTTTFSESDSTITNDTLEGMKTPDDIRSDENINITGDFYDIGEYLKISRDIQSDVRLMKEKQKQLHEDSKSTKEGLISINEALKSMNDVLESVRLEREKASLRSSSSNSSLIDLTDNNEQLEICRDIQNDVHSMKEKQEQLQEDLKSIKNTKEGLKPINKALKSIKDVLETIRLDQEKASSQSCSAQADATDKQLKICRDIQSEMRLMKDKQNELQGELTSTQEGLIWINEALKSMKDVLESIRLEKELESIRLEKEKASLRSSSANYSDDETDDDDDTETDEQLEISRDIQSDVRSMKEKQKQLQEDLKSMKDDMKSIKNDLKSTRLEREKANSSSVNSSQTTSAWYRTKQNYTNDVFVFPPWDRQ